MILTYNKIKDRNQAQKHFKNKGYSTKIINKETGYILFVTKLKEMIKMEILREIRDEYTINNKDDTEQYLKEFFNEDREHFIVLGLDSKNKVIYREIAHIGTLNSAIIHPREVFKKAIIMSCSSIITAHNHPSGNSKPSEDDLKIQRTLIKCGKLLQIKIRDNLIIGKNGINSIMED